MDAQSPSPSGLHDFDGLVGRWHVQHRRLKERLKGCTEWETFTGTSELRPLMDGHANVDDNVLELPSGTYRAASLRTYDPRSGLWAIWWFDGRDPHRLDPPVKGRFEDGVGRFFADDTLRGEPIVVRYTWSEITAASARWEQAFSPDGGRTWEVNWDMRFTRA
jgi:hypothetical protein